MDDALATWLNRRVRQSPRLARGVGLAAERLATLEVALMIALGLSGRGRSAMRMLLAVSVVYLASEILGRLWPRRRPFARLSDVEPLAPHTPERSFPSRHVASGLAMAAIGAAEHQHFGGLMAGVAWLLGILRVAAGLHYPSDVLAGAALGAIVGRCAQRARRTRSRGSISTSPSAARRSIKS